MKGNKALNNRVMEMLHLEVRKKIVAAHEHGLQVKEICRAYVVGKTAVYRLLRQYREEGDITPKTHMRGRKPTLSMEELSAMKKLLDERKDITIEEIKQEMALSLSPSAIRYIVQGKLGYTYKKRQYMPVSEIERMS